MASFWVRSRALLSIFNAYHSFAYVLSLLRFMSTPAVGKAYSKIDARRRDLDLIMKLMPSHPRILEFGSGYSTIYFAFSHASHFASIEEHKVYAPKVWGAKNYAGYISETEPAEVDEWKTRRHANLDFLKDETFDFIYVDGPQTPLAQNGEAAPNVDLVFLNDLDLSKTVIGVDIRLNTVNLLEIYLQDSHYIIYSKKIVNKLHRDKSMAEALHDGHEIDLKLKLTTLFIPKNFSKSIKL
jgi:hypothetical protein